MTHDRPTLLATAITMLALSGCPAGPATAGDPAHPAVSASSPTSAAPPDPDGDGIAGDEDACPDEPGMASDDPARNGCKPADTDGDGVIDARDRCPGVATAESSDRDHDGCPDDSDGDGIADEKDPCPRDPAGAQGSAEEPGCPKLVRVTATQIELREKVLFAIDKADVLPASGALLDEIAAALQRHPEITRLEVQGHYQEKPYAASSISQKRAESVRKELIRRGVEPSRLLSKGYGDSRPLVMPDAKDAAQINRRIELWILPAP